MDNTIRKAADILVEQGWLGDEELNVSVESEGKQWLPSDRHWFAYAKCDRCQRTHLPIVEINTPEVMLDFATSSPSLPENPTIPFVVSVSIETSVRPPKARKRWKQGYCVECMQAILAHLIARHIKRVSIEQALTVPDPIVHSVAKAMIKVKEEDAENSKLD